MKIGAAILLMLLLLLTGCASDPTKDGKYVSDQDGNIYHVQHRIGDCYFLSPIDKDQIKDLLLSGGINK